MYPIDKKINFRRVPQSGFAAGKGYRAGLARHQGNHREITPGTQER